VKRRRVFNPKQPESSWSIWGALEGSPEQLYDRVRAGTATPEERALLVDLHRGRIKAGRFRKGQISAFENHAIAELVVVMKAITPSEPLKNIVPHVAGVFGVSERQVYNAREEFGETIPQTDLNDLPARRRYLEYMAAVYFVSRWGFPYIAVSDSRGTRVEKLGGGVNRRQTRSD
jgi:hypothetical protein